jgi:hypothetical protein
MSALDVFWSVPLPILLVLLTMLLQPDGSAHRGRRSPRV